VFRSADTRSNRAETPTTVRIKKYPEVRWSSPAAARCGGRQPHHRPEPGVVTGRHRPHAGELEVSEDPLSIGLLAPPWVAVPPPAYGGMESVVDQLASGLSAAGHQLTLYTTG
jgi:hypothetical protein